MTKLICLLQWLCTLIVQSTLPAQCMYSLVTEQAMHWTSNAWLWLTHNTTNKLAKTRRNHNIYKYGSVQACKDQFLIVQVSPRNSICHESTTSTSTSVWAMQRVSVLVDYSKQMYSSHGTFYKGLPAISKVVQTKAEHNEWAIATSTRKPLHDMRCGIYSHGWTKVWEHT